MHVKTLRFLCTRNAFVPCTYVKWRYETHSLDADDIPHGSLSKKNYCLPFGTKEIYFLSVFRQGKLLALYTKSARGWYLTLCFDSKNIYPHIFYIVYHCSPCLVHQNSAYLRDANQLTETVSGGLTHCVRGQRSVVP